MDERYIYQTLKGIAHLSKLSTDEKITVYFNDASNVYLESRKND